MNNKNIDIAYFINNIAYFMKAFVDDCYQCDEKSL